MRVGAQGPESRKGGGKGDRRGVARGAFEGENGMRRHPRVRPPTTKNNEGERKQRSTADSGGVSANAQLSVASVPVCCVLSNTCTPARIAAAPSSVKWRLRKPRRVADVTRLALSGATPSNCPTGSVPTLCFPDGDLHHRGGHPIECCSLLLLLWACCDQRDARFCYVTQRICVVDDSD